MKKIVPVLRTLNQTAVLRFSREGARNNKVFLGAFILAVSLSVFQPLPLPGETTVTSEVIRPPSATVREGLNKLISLDLRDINVVDILKFLALEGSLNVVTSKGVQGRSTLLLKNVTIGDALDIIVISNQLAYNILNGIIYVMSETEYLNMYGKSFSDQREIRMRTLQYAKPSYVLTALQNIQSTIGKVIVDEETGAVIMIDTKDKLEEMMQLLDGMEGKPETKVIKLNNAKARDVEAQLKSKLDAKAVGTIMSDERSNQIIVTGYPGRMDEVIPLIESLDRTNKAVLIDVRILQVIINPRYDYGIDWEKAFSKSDNQVTRTLDFRGAFPVSPTLSTANSLGTIGKIAVGDISDTEFSIELKALKQVQETNVLANPRLMILDRQEARINIGDKIPYVVTTTTGTGTNVSVSEDIKFIDVGITLIVTPVIGEDNRITMKIRPEISSRTGTLTSRAGAEIPLVNTTFIESTIVVKDKNTIILGGLRRDDLSVNDKGVPYLMDIPVLGHLFKSRSDQTKKSEIVIFISPKIVSPDEDMTDTPIPIKPLRLQGEKSHA